MYINPTYLIIAIVAIIAVILAIKYKDKFESLFKIDFKFPELSQLTIWLVALTAFIYLTQFVWLNADGSPLIASISPGRLSTIIFANFTFILFIIVAKVAIKHMDKTLFKYHTNDWKNDFQELTSWQKILTTLFVFFAFLFSLIAIFSVVG